LEKFDKTRNKMLHLKTKKLHYKTYANSFTHSLMYFYDI